MLLFSHQINIKIGKDKISIGTNHDVRAMGKPSIHAEIDALNKIRKYKNAPTNVDVFVIRFCKSGMLAKSRPCFDCICSLENSNVRIKNVYYSNKNNTIVKEKFRHMKHNDLTRQSYGYKKLKK